MADSDVSRHFRKSVLLAVAAELEIDAKPSDTKAAIIQKIRDDVEENGLLEEMTDDCWDVMVLMDFMDEEGNELDESAEDESAEDEPVEKEANELPEELPQCFGWADIEYSPACRRCKISAHCGDRTRTVTIPNLPCWGDYEDDDETCEDCVLWRECQDSGAQKDD